MLIRTRVFELCNGKYRSLSDLAQSMELSVSQVYRVRDGKRGINQKFIIGAKKAFPECRLDDLFYLEPEPRSSGAGGGVSQRYQHIVQQYRAADSPGL